MSNLQGPMAPAFMHTISTTLVPGRHVWRDVEVRRLALASGVAAVIPVRAVVGSCRREQMAFGVAAVVQGAGVRVRAGRRNVRPCNVAMTHVRPYLVLRAGFRRP